MKKIAIAFMAITLMLTACKKTDIKGDKDTLTEATYLTLQSTVNTKIDYAARTTSSVAIKIGSVGVSVDKINIYVVKGADLDKTKWKSVKSFPYSDGVTLTVKATEIAAALGVSVDALNPGSSYTLYNEAVTKDGRNFSLANITTDFESQAPYNMAMRWTAVVVCPFVAPVGGTYRVIEDGWKDWNPGDLVQITDGPGANQVNISQVWPNPAFAVVTNPLVVNVDPATGTATVAPSSSWADYGNFIASSTGGTGFVFSCTGLIDLSIDITAGGFGDQGNQKLVLQKQ
jgi:hypothetical protein